MKTFTTHVPWLLISTICVTSLACSNLGPQDKKEDSDLTAASKEEISVAALEHKVHIDVTPRGEFTKNSSTGSGSNQGPTEPEENYQPPDLNADDGFTEEMIEQHEEQMQEPSRVPGSVDSSRPSYEIGPDSSHELIKILPKEQQTRFNVGLHPDFQPGTYQIYAIWSRNENPLPQAQHGISSISIRFLNDQSGANGYDRNVKFDVENVLTDAKPFDTSGRIEKGDNVRFPAAYPPGSDGYAQRMRAIERGLWSWNGDYNIQFSQTVEGDGEGMVGAAREVFFRLRGDEGHEDVMISWVETDGKRYTLYNRLRLGQEWEEFRILAHVEASVQVNTLETPEDSAQCHFDSDSNSDWKSIGVYYLSPDAYVTISNRNIFQFHVESRIRLVPIYDPELNQTEAFRCLGGALFGHGLRR